MKKNLSCDRKGVAAKTAAIAAVAIIVAAGIGIFVLSDYGHSATVQISISSKANDKDVYVVVYADTEKIWVIEKMPPLSTESFAYHPHFGLFTGSKCISFRAGTAVEPPDEPSFCMEDVTVFDGKTYDITLRI